MLSRPVGHIFDLDIRTEGDDIICTADAEFEAKLFDGDTLLGEAVSEKGKAVFTVKNHKEWNAETPNLYTVKFYAKGEEITRKIGFITIGKSDKNELLINGKPVKLRGVNRHDTHPEKGWTMSDEDIYKDLVLMKQCNINTIRTAHYPPTSKFLDYCDELGFYVVLETDFETHGIIRRFANAKYIYDTSDTTAWPCSNPDWKEELVDRMARAYERDKIHTSILMWSTGNECGYGENQNDMVNWVRERDNKRIIHCQDASKENAHEYTDIYSSMYARFDELDTWAADETKNLPVFLCEYAHAMGNGPGAIWDYWEKFYAEDKLVGGCIWEWSDHAVLVEGVQKYGGDFEGELTHDKHFCCDGMVFSDRSFKPGTFEIKNTYAPFRIKMENGKLIIKNCYDFLSFAGHTFLIDVTVDGESIEKKTITLDTAPHCEETVEVDAKLPENCRLGAFVAVKMLDESGFELGELQEKLSLPIIAQDIKSQPLSLMENDFEIIAEVDGFKYILSKQSGFLESIKINGEEQLLEPMKLSYFRPLTDNDGKMQLYWDRSTIWQGENLDCVFNKVYSYEINGNKAIFVGSSAGVSRYPFFKFTLTYEFFADGKVNVSLNGNVREQSTWLPRIGFEFKLPYNKDKFSYFGMGPMDCYCDMCHHGVVGYHDSDADSGYVNYVRPQEMGNHFACKELDIKNSLKVSADNMEICVLHYETEGINTAKHTDELKRSDGTHIRIDYKDSGIGTGSCGPATLPKYQLSDKEIDFNIVISV